AVEEIVEEPVVEETVEEIVEEPVVEETEEAVEEPVVEETVEEIVEEPVVEEAVEEAVEEPVVEETVEEAVEEPVETSVVEEIAPAAVEADEDDDDEDDDVMDEQVIQTRRRFLAKLDKLNKKSKAYYDEIRAFILGHKKVHSRMSSGYESFTMHRIAKARAVVRGKDVAICLALNAKDYESYFFKDLSVNGSFDDTPMMVTLKSDRDVRLLKEVLDTLLNG
ncbi:MAG: hypothetical protein IJ329_01855, partial [Clostridia bacterium]|nr:hypothetical protein [Clostridia bacterium]